MADLMFYLRVATFLIWAAVAVVKLPPVLRYLRGREFTKVDEYRAVLFFVALVFIGSISRWLFAPNDESLFLAVTALSCGLGCFVLILSRQNRSE